MGNLTLDGREFQIDLHDPKVAAPMNEQFPQIGHNRILSQFSEVRESSEGNTVFIDISSVEAGQVTGIINERNNFNRAFKIRRPKAGEGIDDVKKDMIKQIGGQ